MANIIFRSLKKEDFPQAPQWIVNMFYILNQFGNGVFQAFNKNITFQQNIDCQIFSYTFNREATFSPIDIQTTIKRNADGVIILSCYNNTSREAVAGVCSWIPINGGVSITDITNTSSGNQYVVKFLIL